MLKLTTDTAVFGPFATIETLADRYRCNDVDLPFNVVGQGVISDVEDGDFPPPESPVVIPAVVTMAQTRKAMILSGVSIAAVNAAIAAIPDATERQLAQTDWEYSTTVRRQSPLVASLAPVLGLTEAEINEMFVLAATL